MASLPSASEQAVEIVKLITEFEQSVVAADGALTVRDWSTVDALLRNQRRLTHALLQALEVSRDARPAAFTAEVERRLTAIAAWRTGQLQGLVAFNHAVGSRLTMISRTREMRRGNVDETPAPRILDSMR